MACRDCGPAAKAVQNCKVFTFPLGQGEVDIVFRGTMTREDITEQFPAFQDFAQHAMEHMVPTREEQRKNHAPTPQPTIEELRRQLAVAEQRARERSLANG